MQKTCMDDIPEESVAKALQKFPQVLLACMVDTSIIQCDTQIYVPYR